MEDIVKTDSDKDFQVFHKIVAGDSVRICEGKFVVGLTAGAFQSKTCLTNIKTRQPSLSLVKTRQEDVVFSREHTEIHLG